MRSRRLAQVVAVWADRSRRRYLLAFGLIVATVVTGAHRLLPRYGLLDWLPFHAAVPSVVFSLGAWAGGARRLDLPLALRGAGVVGAVTAAFGIANAHPLPLPFAGLLNLLVPLAVSTLGALGHGPAAPADPKPGVPRRVGVEMEEER